MFYVVRAVLWERVWGGRILEYQIVLVSTATTFEVSEYSRSGV